MRDTAIAFRQFHDFRRAIRREGPSGSGQPGRGIFGGRWDHHAAAGLARASGCSPELRIGHPAEPRREKFVPRPADGLPASVEPASAARATVTGPESVVRDDQRGSTSRVVVCHLQRGHDPDDGQGSRPGGRSTGIVERLPHQRRARRRILSAERAWTVLVAAHGTSRSRPRSGRAVHVEGRGQCRLASMACGRSPATPLACARVEPGRIRQPSRECRDPSVSERSGRPSMRQLPVRPRRDLRRDSAEETRTLGNACHVVFWEMPCARTRDVAPGVQTPQRHRPHTNATAMWHRASRGIPPSTGFWSPRRSLAPPVGLQERSEGHRARAQRA